MSKHWVETALCAALIGLIGCAENGPAVATEDAVLVEVGPTAIRVADYRQFLARVAPELRAEYGAEKLLEAIVEQTLLVQEAAAAGLGRECGVCAMAGAGAGAVGTAGPVQARRHRPARGRRGGTTGLFPAQPVQPSRAL